jgi:RNA polymerase sigma factor (sigma-70 family)
MSQVRSAIAILHTREVHPMHELQPASLAGKGSVQVCLPRPWPSRSATGPPLHHGPVAPPTPPAPAAWPVLWARCWGRIRTWRVPPRWSFRDWCDEARAQGALAVCLARREFDPRRCVPFDAFLYRRVVEAVRTRHRQEWSFGSRAKPDDDVSLANLFQRSLPDPDLLEHMTHALEQLTEPERRLIHQLFWDGQSVGELARVSGVSQELLRKRKSRALHKLRVYLEECV